MKTNILILLIVSTFALYSCTKSYIIDMAPEVEKIIEESEQKPHKDSIDVKANVDTTNTNDTSKVPIGFNVTVEDWEERNVNI